MLLNTYKHRHNETLLLFTLFVSMSRPRSNYAVSVQSFFHFYLHFCYTCLYTFMNTDMLVLLLTFQSKSHYFCMITWTKNVNNFQIAKVQPQGFAQHLLDFFANFSLALLIKLLPMKKACVATSCYEEIKLKNCLHPYVRSRVIYLEAAIYSCV